MVVITILHSDLNFIISWQVNWDMSSDSVKENASVVDSSVTEWKHDIRNSDEPGCDNVCFLVTYISCEM